MKRLLLLLILTIGEMALAVTGTTALKKTENRSSVFLPESLFIPAVIDFGGTVSDKTQSEGMRTVGLKLVPTWQITEDIALSAAVGVTQEYVIEKVIYSNTNLKLSLPSLKLLNEKLIVTPNLLGSLPTNYIAYRDETYRGSFGLGAIASAMLFELNFPLAFTYGFSGGKNLHNFRRNNKRKSNLEYYLSHAMSLSKTVGKVTFTLAGNIDPSWNYEGIYEPTFALAQVLSYTSDIGVTYSLSHLTTDRALDYRGDFSNVKVLDDYNSRINFKLSYIIK